MSLTSSGALPSRGRLLLQGPRQSWQTLVIMTPRQSEQKMVPQLVMLRPVLTWSADFLQMLQCSHLGLMVQVWLVTWLRSFYLTFFEFPFFTLSESLNENGCQIVTKQNGGGKLTEICENSCSCKWYKMTGQITLQIQKNGYWSTVLLFSKQVDYWWMK